MITMIIDGKNAVLGRLGTVAAKKALLGEEIHIINAEQIIISGSREVVFAKYMRLRKMGTPRKGPFYFTNPAQLVKRILRGMLPHRQEKGREALARIKCYVGVPKELEGKDAAAVGQSSLRINAVSIAEICKHIGGKQ